VSAVEEAGWLLEAIRRKEAEVKRRLAAEHQAAEAALAEAEQRARELIAAGEAEGWRQGEAERQAAQAEAEREAEAIIAQARAEAEALERAAAAWLAVATARALEIVIGGPYET